MLNDGIFILLYSTKICYMMAICGFWGFYILRRLMLSICKYTGPTVQFPFSYFLVGKNSWFSCFRAFFPGSCRWQYRLLPQYKQWSKQIYTWHFKWFSLGENLSIHPIQYIRRRQYKNPPPPSFSLTLSAFYV